MDIPRATYRLQFNSSFRFRDAKELVPYLAGLGISHVYASPIFKARKGSPHGYDILDPNEINPELGTQADFEALVCGPEEPRHRLDPGRRAQSHGL